MFQWTDGPQNASAWGLPSWNDSAVAKIGVAAVAFVLALAGTSADGLAAEEETVRAVAAWSGQGWFFPSGPEEALFAGVLRGILFVENSRGALDSARMVCPVKLEMHRVSGRQSGEGRCIFTSRDQHQVFAHHLDGELDQIADVDALDELEDDIVDPAVFADIVNAGDVLVIQPRCGLGLIAEPA